MFTSSARGLPSAGDLAWHGPCRLATTAALPAATYANGPPATLTANANGALGSIDGVLVLPGDRLLVKNQAAAAQNGIYVASQLGDGTHPWTLTRAPDADTAAELPAGSVTFVTAGLTNGALLWSLTTAVVNINTTAETWTSRSAGDLAWHAPVAAVASTPLVQPATYAAGPPATLTANVGAILSIDLSSLVTGERVLVAGQAAPATNGIYVITDVGTNVTPWVLTRAPDADTAAELPQGSIVYSARGNANSLKYWYLTSLVTNIDTFPQTWIPTRYQPTMTRTVYTANGTWTQPTTANYLGTMMRAVGGGGAGGGAVATAAGQGSCGSGGGGGAYAEFWLGAPSILAGLRTITVGAGGVAAAGAVGGNGGASQLIGVLVAGGGTGGAVTVAAATSVVAVGGPGGAATTGDIKAAGSDGMAGMILNAGYLPLANGGASAFGGARAAVQANNAGNAGNLYGGGGSGAGNGASQAARAGGNGAAGIFIIDDYYSG